MSTRVTPTRLRVWVNLAATTDKSWTDRDAVAGNDQYLPLRVMLFK